MKQIRIVPLLITLILGLTLVGTVVGQTYTYTFHGLFSEDGSYAGSTEVTVYFENQTSITFDTNGSAEFALDFDGTNDYAVVMNDSRTTGPMVQNWFNYSYLYCRKITFDGSALVGNVVNVPIAVILNSSNFDFGFVETTIGIDIRFVDADNSTELYHEQERWDYTNSRAQYWVRVPQIDAGSTTDHIFIYYGVAGADTASTYLDVSNVWDNDYVMVQHMNDWTSTSNDDAVNNNETVVADSTANANDGALFWVNTTGLGGWWAFEDGRASATIADSSGNGNTGTWVGKAAADQNMTDSIQGLGDTGVFDGVNDGVLCGRGASIDNFNDFTMGFLVEVEPGWATGIPFSKHKKYVAIQSNGQIRVVVSSAGDNGLAYSQTGVISAGTKYFIHITFDNSSDRIPNIFVNGTEVPSYDTEQAATGLLTADNGNDIFIGAYTAGSNWLEANIDCVRYYDRAFTTREMRGDMQQWTTGLLDGVIEFDGRSTYVQIPDSATLDVAAITLEAWIMRTSVQATDYGRIADKNHAYDFRIRSSTNLPFVSITTVGGGDTFYWTNVTVIGLPVHLVATYSASDDTVRLYQDGRLDSETVHTNGGVIAVTATNIDVGNRGALDRAFNGTIDEIRISNITRSSDWINAQSLSVSYSTRGDLASSTSSYTLYAWFNCPTRPIDAVAMLLDRYTGLTGYYVRMISASGGIGLVQYTSTGGQLNPRSLVDYADGLWHFMVISVDITTKTGRIYVDNALADTATYTGVLIPAIGEQCQIGGRLTTNNWDGLLDEVRIYGRTMGVAEIDLEYNDGYGRHSASDGTNLTARWHFNEGTGNWANDTTGVNNAWLGGGVAANRPSWVGGYIRTSPTFTYGEIPEGFSWNVSGVSVPRFFIPTGDTTENFFLFDLDAAGDDYLFEVLDYAQALSPFAWIESTRHVNGSAALIERREVTSDQNEVPMVLVTGATYEMQIRDSNGNIYRFGFFIPGSDNPILKITAIKFSRRVQLAYRYVRVEATRSTNNSRIIVNYADELTNTQYLNCTIRYRNNNSIVYTDVVIDPTGDVQWNWNGADNETDYIVSVDIDHGSLSSYDWRKTLGLSPTLNRPFDLSFFGPSDINLNDAFFMLIVIATGGAFSVASAPVGMAVMGATAWAFWYRGWMEIDQTMISLVICFAFIMAITVAKRRL